MKNEINATVKAIAGNALNACNIIAEELAQFNSNSRKIQNALAMIFNAEHDYIVYLNTEESNDEEKAYFNTVRTLWTSYLNCKYMQKQMNAFRACWGLDVPFFTDYLKK